MRLSLNPEEKGIMRSNGRINLKCFIQEDYFGHYYIELIDGEAFVKAKKRGIKQNT